MAWTAPATWTTSEVVTATKMNTHVRDNMKEVWRRLAYIEFTADVTTTTHTEAAPLDVVSSGAITYTAEPIKIEFGCEAFSAAVRASLWDDTTDLGRLSSDGSGAAGSVHGPIAASRSLTPSAASHTYKVRIWTSGGSGAVAHAGAGGAGIALPGFIAVWQKGGA